MAHEIGVIARGGAMNTPIQAFKPPGANPLGVGQSVAERCPSVPGPTKSTPPMEHESDALSAIADVTDRSLHAAFARFTLGISPAALAQAYLDWATHLSFAPGKRLQLVDKALRKSLRFSNYAWRYGMSGGNAGPCIEPLAQDRRFSGTEWQQWPFNFAYQSFLLNQQWWHNATTGVRGLSRQHEAIVSFGSRQILDMMSPSNFPLTNPEILRHTVRTGGLNLINALRNLSEDWERAVSGKPPVGAENFVVGRDVAVTPGKVIYRNRLIELIRYAPSTDRVRPEPILIIPAWIMKYYILDLSAHNSMVRYLTEQGFTVFMVSWKNPGQADRDLGMDDYFRLGLMAAIDGIDASMGKTKIHAVGYCLGGTLLAIGAAAMARDGDERLRSISLLAAQTDFTAAGELMLFINESQLAFLDDMMWEQGFLDGQQMAGAFQILRSNDLIWSRLVRDYMIGERQPMTDLMAWNADATRLPYRMHTEYLRHLFLDNDLAEGRFFVEGKPVALTDIRVPLFAVATVQDHVAPWRSTYQIHLQTDTEVTYLLTSGGHNAGIISELHHEGRHYQLRTKRADDHYVDPETFLAEAVPHAGSWWPQWVGWLIARSDESVPAPPQPILGLCDAPGTYVRQS
jgi:polyhydroxyalkanoate synthase